MRFQSVLLMFVLLVVVQAKAQHAVLIEEGGVPMSAGSESVTSEPERSSIGWNHVTTGGDYETAEDMRKARRVGVGIETFGKLGLLGLNFEMNFGSLDSATAGFGGGPGYNAFALGAKHVFGGSRVSPYAAAAVSLWNGSSKNGIDDTTPGYLGDTFLSGDEKKTGRFAKTFLSPSLGLQFNQLHGESAGGTLFAEVLLLTETSEMKAVPTAAFGAMYFF